MDPGLYPLITVLPLVLLLSGIICRAAAAGRLNRNMLVGYRLRALLQSDRAWRAGRAAAEAPSWTGFVLSGVSAAFAVATAPAFLALEVVVFIFFFGWAIHNATQAATNAG